MKNKLRTYSSAIVSFILIGCGEDRSDSAKVFDSTSPPQSSEDKISNSVDDALGKYLSRTNKMTCEGLESFDFVLEAATLIGEWCRAQNEQLKDSGCGVGTNLCIQELITAERPGPVLILGVNTFVEKYDGAFDGRSIEVSRYHWGGDPVTGTSSYGGDYSGTRLGVGFTVGIEVPLGPKVLKRKTCVSPLYNPYVGMLAEKLIRQNPQILDYAAQCRVSRQL